MTLYWIPIRSRWRLVSAPRERAGVVAGFAPYWGADVPQTMYAFPIA